MKDVVVRYIRHPNTGNGIGCVVAVNTPEGIKLGWAQCNPKDVFNKKQARAIAIQRAINPPKVPLRPASVKFKLYHTGYSAFEAPRVQTVTVVDPITPILEVVEAIAKRAFGPRERPPIHDAATCNETCKHESIPTLPPGLVYTENGNHIIEEKTGKVVARLVNDNYELV